MSQHPEACPVDVLEPRGCDEWVTKNHLMLAIFPQGQIGILIHTEKSVEGSCWVTENYPLLERTDVQDPSCIER